MDKDTAKFVLGIDLGGTKIALATADTQGHILQRQVISTNAAQGAEQAITRAFATGLQLIAQTRTETNGELAGVGIANMGITEEDRILMAPNVPGWDRLKLPQLARQTFETEAIHIENDVKAAAQAELYWGALAGTDTAIYLNLGTGISATLVVGGRIVRGAHGAAGEIAYNLRHVHDELGISHGHAPLEEYVGGGFIGKRAQRQFDTLSTAEEVFRLAPTDPQARTFVEATLSELAFHVTNLAITLDPERLVIGGGLMRSKELIIPHLEAHFKRFVPFPPSIHEAQFSNDAGLMGAIALAL
ncbi:ROK family protein [Ktedonosporobacter rubrisoli]|uniref:ROK family protein n=1 Tax=Ktedonosporobacter rubrisoli TaxID=2509675 RepID=A0A4P6JYP7_KTERU|nr:ROK family protein [Ktedonosporobacter rubrisoli]QBD80938.1 ROK family protein [Ktedonosporobacter rubrisoli]